eukprot:7386178-Prymnesium_polylepis.2
MEPTSWPRTGCGRASRNATATSGRLSLRHRVACVRVRGRGAGAGVSSVEIAATEDPWRAVERETRHDSMSADRSALSGLRAGQMPMAPAPHASPPVVIHEPMPRARHDGGPPRPARAIASTTDMRTRGTSRALHAPGTRIETRFAFLD